MTTKRTITLDIEMFSEASEADMYTHMEEFCANVVQSAKDAATQSWNRGLMVDWEKSFRVDITVEEQKGRDL